MELLTILSKTRNQNTKIGGDKQEPQRIESNLREITNALLRRVIERIEVAHNGNVEVFLKLGIDETVPIFVSTFLDCCTKVV